MVHGFGPYFGMPDGSPFVMKTMIQLKMTAYVERMSQQFFSR